MNPDTLALYESWDLTPPSLPPRSRLYCLQPLGIGTPEVESLTGYVARLAEAHGVYTRTLVMRELVPLLGRPHLSKLADSSLTSFWTGGSRALNGAQTLARDWVLTLEILTLRRDLRFLTLSTWADVLPSRGLLRPTRAWCPACYQEWQQNGQVVYEPLFWALTVVDACPHHRQRLHSRCPYPDCGQPSPLLASRSRPGYCSRCERWLGGSSAAERVDNEVLPENELNWQTWVVNTVGELLATAPTLPTPPQRENVAAAVSACIAQVTGGNMSALANQLPVSPVTMSAWQRGKALPQLASLLQLCDRLQLSLLRLLTEGADAVILPKLTASPLPQPPPQPKAQRRPFDTNGIRCALEAVLAGDEMPPPAMRQVAERLGYAHSSLHHYYPDLCRAISARYLTYRQEHSQQRKQQCFAEIREAVAHIHQRGMYPSAYRVAQRLTAPGFIRHPEARAVWRDAIQALGWTSEARR